MTRPNLEDILNDIKERLELLLEREQELADDLAGVLSGLHDISNHDIPDWQRVMARYREARGTICKTCEGTGRIVTEPGDYGDPYSMTISCPDCGGLGETDR